MNEERVELLERIAEQAKRYREAPAGFAKRDIGKSLDALLAKAFPPVKTEEELGNELLEQCQHLFFRPEPNEFTSNNEAFANALAAYKCRKRWL